MPHLPPTEDRWGLDQSAHDLIHLPLGMLFGLIPLYKMGVMWGLDKQFQV